MVVEIVGGLVMSNSIEFVSELLLDERWSALR